MDNKTGENIIIQSIPLSKCSKTVGQQEENTFKKSTLPIIMKTDTTTGIKDRKRGRK